MYTTNDDRQDKLIIADRPLRILMILHMPWSKNLGGSRVQLELAEEFRARGHVVEKFDYHDAFPQGKSLLSRQFFYSSFPKKAKAFVRANAHRFDVIDAHQGNLPFTKEELGFKGLLVTRSVGLYAFYDQFHQQEQARKPPQKLKTRLGNYLRFWKHQRENYMYPCSFQTCDLINLPNQDELTYVRDTLNHGAKSRVFPFGLSRQRQMAFAKAMQSAEIKLSQKQIVFVGTWGTRKGSNDWREIILRVKKKVPEASFLFLGTGVNSQKVLQNLNLPSDDYIQIIPKYDSEELPQLMSHAAVGAFPSYIEGFGFAVLEKLACGIPTVAYDVPGPREMLKDLDSSWLTPPGDIQKFSQQLIDLLNLELDKYAQLSQQCMQMVSNFSWSKIAEDTLNSYYQCLEKQT